MMNLKVSRIHKFTGEGKAKAAVDIIVNGEIVIKGFKVIEVEDKLIVGVPREKGKEDRWYPIIRFLTEDIREELNKVVFEAYNK
jgi:DNA-binding cell septation regulator SpoVG